MSSPAASNDKKQQQPKPTFLERIYNLGSIIVYSILGLLLVGFLGNKFIILMEKTAPSLKAKGTMLELDNSTHVHLYCAGNGAKTLLFEPNIAGSHVSFVHWVHSISNSTGYRACTYDRIGHAHSSHKRVAATATKPKDEDAMSAQEKKQALMQAVEFELFETLDLVLKNIASEHVVLVGHGFGSNLLGSYALKRHNQQIKSLILMNPVPKQTNEVLTNSMVKTSYLGLFMSITGALRIVTATMSADFLPKSIMTASSLYVSPETKLQQREWRNTRDSILNQQQSWERARTEVNYLSILNDEQEWNKTDKVLDIPVTLVLSEKYHANCNELNDTWKQVQQQDAFVKYSTATQVQIIPGTTFASLVSKESIVLNKL